VTRKQPMKANWLFAGGMFFVLVGLAILLSLLLRWAGVR